MLYHNQIEYDFNVMLNTLRVRGRIFLFILHHKKQLYKRLGCRSPFVFCCPVIQDRFNLVFVPCFRFHQLFSADIIQSGKIFLMKSELKLSLRSEERRVGKECRTEWRRVKIEKKKTDV